MKIPNLPYIRTKDARLYEAFKAVQEQTSTIENQGNFNATGHPEPPPAINALKVTTGPSGEFQAAITDNGKVGRGINYWLEHDSTPDFQNPHVIDLGQSRNHSVNLGSQQLYWRAYSSYPSSDASPVSYHGSQESPSMVQGGVPGQRAPSQGAGTGAPGYGTSGPGPIDRRDDISTYDWTKQRRAAGISAGFQGAGTPAGIGALGSSGGSGGGGGGISAPAIIVDTHANRLANFPSVKQPVNTFFWESDRTLEYWVQNAAGTVTVTGGVNVAWVSGNHFVNTGTGFTAAQWPAGTPIVIAGVTRLVATVVSSTSLTIQTATTNAAGVAYSVASGRWVYFAGQMQSAWANLPADLGENDATLTFYDNADSFHIWEWTGAAYVWGPGNRASGEMAEFDADPGVGWHACDGTASLTKYAASGTRSTSFTVPDRRGFYTEGAASYTGTGVAAASPAATATGGGVTLSTTTVLNGTLLPQTVVTGISATTQPTITLNTPPIPTFATLYYYRL